MKVLPRSLAGIISIVALSSVATAQTTIWTDGAGDQFWSTAANWSAGVPTTSSAVQIGTQPTGDQIGIDTGATTVASFTFDSTLTDSVDITAFGTDTLQVNGPVTNNSGFTHSFSLPFNAGANATWSGPLAFTNIVNIDLKQITMVNTITFTNIINFEITNVSNYGRLLGAGSAIVTGAVINILGTYTGVAGDTFDFTTGNFSGATLNILPTLSGGLTWDTSNFLANGTLTVVPEPITWALLAGGLTVITLLRRRRRA